MLRLDKIAKSFSGIPALQNISLSFAKGEVHAICGENGAGKSTLMNIVMGNLQPDEGKIYWEEQLVNITNVLSARRLGISMVYQERSLADALSIAENIFPVEQPLTAMGLIDHEALYKKTQTILNDLGLQVSPKTIVKNLSAALKQMVEIAKALAQDPALLIFDEPTASLTNKETKILFEIIKNLKKKSVSIIYITHRLSELHEIADRISVLKDGKFAGTVSGKTPLPHIISMMVGRELEVVDHHSHALKEIKLEAKKIGGNGFRNISFQIFKGEILGFAGLQGSGRTELAKSLFGDEPITDGMIIKDGKEYFPAHPFDALDHHIAYVPEERKTESLFLEKSIAENIFSAQLKKGFYQERLVNHVSKHLCATYNIRTASLKQPVRQLSGGNQQKMILAKWLALNPDLLIVNEPTHGVDVGAKADIYQLLKKLTAQGKSIFLISSELTELLLLADRIAVMHEGNLIAMLKREDATEENITALASGIHYS